MTQYCNWLSSGILMLSGIGYVYSDDVGLPIATQAGSVDGNLTSPALHSGIDIGSAMASYSADGHKLTIEQTTKQVILDWNSFDIGAGNSVQFVQPDTTSIALNNIHQLNASEILGNLSANGQLYLVNNNGFVFGQHSEVDTNSLVVSSLNITDTVFKQGIVNVVNNAAPSTSTPGNANTTAVAALTADGVVYRNTAAGQEKIRVLVEKGAHINAADTGRVILAAPEVENDGSIRAQDGQVILAAATDKVYLQESSSSQLRGLLVEVQTGGDAKNLGTILTERGDTTMMGFAVSQQGVISASTSVALNGSIRLLAREGAQLVNTSSNSTTNYILEPISNSTVRSHDTGDGLGQQASVTLAKGSVSQIKLDASDGNAVTGQAQPKSLLDVEAGYIDMKASAKIIAHGGEVNMTANLSPTNSNQYFPDTQPLAPVTAGNNSRIFLETGSSIDVSGASDVLMPMSSNEVDLTLYSYELRNDPIQKNGLLYGKTIEVDTRQGTALADISGAVAAEKYSVYYRNSAAGTVNLISEGDTLIQKGADINISGGWLDYQAGIINMTQLVSNGVVFSLANADPNRIYQQISTLASYQTAYTQGMNAGTVNIHSRDLVLDGNILSATRYGQFQRSAASLPAGGQLNIDTTWSGVYQQDVIFQNSQTYTIIPATGSVFSPLYLSQALFFQVFKHNNLQQNLNLNLKTGGNLLIEPNTKIDLQALANLSLQAGAIDVQGSIKSVGGNVSLTTLVGEDKTRSSTGEIRLSSKSNIDTSGVWINDVYNLQHNNALAALAINAGNISLQAQGDLILSQGAQLNANGGAWLQANTTLNAGTGGAISLSSAGNNTDTLLQLGATLSAYALYNGGSLSIAANSIDISNSGGIDTVGVLQLAAGKLLHGGGFSNYTLTANNGGLTIAENTAIQLRQSNWQLSAAAYNTNGGSLADLTTETLLPDYQRNAVNLTLNVLQTVQGVDQNLAIDIAKNATITTDPLASISLKSDANINIDGSLSAPAGNINISVVAPPNASSDPGYNPNQAITLGADAILSTHGTVIMTPNPAGLAVGKVLDGGTISISANRGYILTAGNSTLDVSGISAGLDIINTQGIHFQLVPGNAGSINLTAAEGMILQGKFLAKAGTGETAAGSGSTAAGGSLNISLNAQNRAEPFDVPFPTGDRIINLSSKTVNLLDSSQLSNPLIPTALNGQAYISTDQITQAGFDSVKLQSFINTGTQSEPEPQNGAINFVGDVNLAVKLNLELDAPQLTHSWLTPEDKGQVILTADTLTLGSSQNQTVIGSLNSSTQPAQLLQLNAANIDLRGAAQISDFALTQINSSGDVQLIGVNPNYQANLLGALNLSGNLDISAREIYPTTLTQYQISIDPFLNPNGTLKILSNSATPVTPLSAAGQLTINAPIIDNAGALLAPFGKIELDAGNNLTLEAHSLTSVADSDNLTIPFGQTQGNGKYWIYPLGTAVNIQSGTPQKTITLHGPSINLLPDSVVNLNGGGDLLAYEFTPAPGGSIDYLNPAYLQSYAILPDLQSGYAAYDAQLFANSGLSLGASIHLSADSGVPAGNYVLLPAYDALLPGAYLITPAAGTTNMTPGSSGSLPDGASVVAGYLFNQGSQVSAALWSGFTVQSGKLISTYSPYLLSTASQFYSSQTNNGVAAALPEDAGDLTLLASQALNIAGQINATAFLGKGLGGMLDISANNIEVVNQAPAINTPNTIILLASNLNQLGVDSILLGGRRTRTSTETQLAVSAHSVDIDKDVALTAPEIILAADDSVKLDRGASISAVGSLKHSDTLLQISNSANPSTDKTNTDGALLRVSSAASALVERNAAGLDQQYGTLDIEAGATLNSAGSILLDASKTGTILGNIQMTQGELTLSSSLITLGGGSDSGMGFQLSNAILNQLHVDNLVLNSYSSVNIADGVNLQLNNLSIDAAGIYGYAGDTAKINAGTISLQNSLAAVAAGQAAGSGTLQLTATTITLGAGQYQISGFSQLNLNATGKLLDDGLSALDVNGNVNITTPLWTANAGADTTLNLGAHQLTTTASGTASTNSALGAALTVNAGSINQQTAIDMASGKVVLNASNGLTITGSGSIDTSGQVINLAGNAMYSNGGMISLTSALSDINVAGNLNVSGSKLGGNAGSLVLNAADGSVSLAGTLQGFGYQGANGGNIAIHSNRTSESKFSALSKILQDDGFNHNFAVRLGQGDLALDQNYTLQAASITLTADNGLVDISGNLDVNAAQAGDIRLSGNNGVKIETTASLTAVSTGNANSGGNITLTSAPVNSSSSGVIIAKDANLDVSGGSNGSGGVVDIIVNRLGADNAAIALSGTVHGAASLDVYAMAHYVNVDLSDQQFQQMLTDSQTYLNAAALNDNLQTRLGNFDLLPGLDIQNSSSLSWNISTVLSDAVSKPGLLSIRSGTDININTTLSDGFVPNQAKLQLSSGSSWRYNIAAGADLSSADMQDIVTDGTTGNLTIAANTSIRTGTGDIYLAAGKNIVLSDWTSTVYTAGHQSALTDPYAKYRPTSFAVQYPDQGGNVTLIAGNNIIGAASPQVVSDWLQRSGNWNSGAAVGINNLPTAWGIDFGYTNPTAIGTGTSYVNSTLGFRENIGALGGGNVTVQAGNNIQDLSVVLPTNAVSQLVNGSTVLTEQGGGYLRVTAGGDINGGLFYDEKGKADISAGGAISGGSQFSNGPILALGDTQFNVNAGNGIELSTVLNPFIIAQAGVKAPKMDYFSSYTANSAVKLTSLAGNIVLNNNTSAVTNQIVACLDASCTGNQAGDFYNNLSVVTDITPLLAMYPGSLSAAALTGGIQIENSMSLYSAADSSFNLLASADISFADSVVLTQLDVNPAQLLPLMQPVTSFSITSDYWLANNYDSVLGHAAQPVHSNDTSTNLIASAQGSLIGLGTGATIAAAKATDVSAGLNLNNLSLFIQNLPGTYQDVSTISVGGDILYPSQRNPVTGVFQGSGLIKVAGPGWLNVWAGGSIDLGVSAGITSVGSLYNSALQNYSGAGINLLAGASVGATSQSLSAYWQHYVLDNTYRNQLSQQLNSVLRQAPSTNNLALAGNLRSLLNALATAQQQLPDADLNSHWQLALNILFDQFRLTATEVNIYHNNSAYQAGYDAIKRLFPNPGQADISLDFSQIQTLEGGDINLLAPGGQINVGLAASDIATDKSAAQLGVVAQGQGNVNILTKGDLQVNQSRVFTLEGGDISVWSSDGNIDAGRGTKSSLATQLPIGNYDAYGNLLLVYPASVSGSGIRAQSGYNSKTIGNITLLAPHGVVNAGEAGIAGDNITIAAMAVIGATNIQALGTTLGVPQTQNGFVIPDAVSNAAAAAARNSSINMIEERSDAIERTNKTTRVVMLDTQILGFGRCSVAEVREGKQACGGR